MAIFDEIESVNKDLSSEGTKIRIEKRGSLLNFRGPLPCKSNPSVIRSQRISLNLPATYDGLAKCKKLLQLLLLQLNHNQFQWENWKKNNKKEESNKDNSIVESIENFKILFFNNPSRKGSFSSKRTTWDSAYKPYLRRLQKIGEDKGKDLNKDLFCEVLSSYKLNSRSRKQCSTSLGLFARYLNINLPEDWKALGSGYDLKKYKFRELPNDRLIKDLWNSIPNPSWKLVYGLMACYGLRNHEVFFSDFSSISENGDKVLRVLPTTKTGEHQVWPFHPEWVSLFKLNDLSHGENLLPRINTDLSNTTLQQIGRRVSEQFRRYNLPITPYDLRHAWAIRTIHIGLPDTVSARMMGHSVSIHNRTYHHWITRRDQQQAVDTALAKKINSTSKKL